MPNYTVHLFFFSFSFPFFPFPSLFFIFFPIFSYCWKCKVVGFETMSFSFYIYNSQVGQRFLTFLLFPFRVCFSLRQVPIRLWPKSVWPKAAVWTSSSFLTNMSMWLPSLLFPSSLEALSTNMPASRYRIPALLKCGVAL